ncbi:MAG: hypothetical protein VB093_12195, partial [Propionicimonas sp.]|nr:hypothetical protein [Propionicimonas sp.]
MESVFGCWVTACRGRGGTLNKVVDLVGVRTLGHSVLRQGWVVERGRGGTLNKVVDLVGVRVLGHSVPQQGW